MSIVGINGTPTLDGGNVDTVINNDAGETLLLTNMIIKNGYTSGSGAAIYQYGGFLDLVDVDLKYNDSGSNGGGIHISNSGTLYGDNVNFSFNTSGGHGGGLYASGNATVDLQDSYFYLNYADSKGGGIRGYDLASLNLIDTEFFYNFSDADYDDVGGGGAIALYATTLNASDSGTGTYNCEFYYNIDSALNSDAAVLLDKSTANFTDCDFTDDTNAYDNYKYDIATAGSGYRYEYPSNTTVSCDEYECGSAVSDYTGLSYADFTSSSTSSTYLVGHIIQSEGTRTIDYFELWMGTGTDCSPTYYVYESSDKSSWSEIWSGVGDLITYATHNSSGDVGVPTKDGYYYALVGHYDMSVCAELTYTYSSFSQPTDVSFGTCTDYIFDAGWAPGDIIIGNGTGYSFWGRVRSSH
jgi:predicted outer membrane repeat protein